MNRTPLSERIRANLNTYRRNANVPGEFGDMCRAALAILETRKGPAGGSDFK